MGIDQVAQVNEIVRSAITHRQQRVTGESSKLKAQSSKKNVSTRLAELDQKRPAGDHDESLRGTEKFGKTKTALVPATVTHHASRVTNPILDVTQRPTFIPDFDTPRFRLTPKHFAYVKIAEGCNHPCSFCIIPRMRGTHRSRTQKDIVKEVK